MDNELNQHIRDVHSTVAWLCFCVLHHEKRTLSDTQLSIMLHTDVKRIRSSLNELWTDNMVVRVSNAGHWKLDLQACRAAVVGRLRAIKSANETRASKHKDSLVCSACGNAVEVESEYVMDFMMKGQDPLCTCGSELIALSPSKLEDFVDRRLATLQATTSSASPGDDRVSL